MFLPTLTHALFTSKDPFEEFWPSSPAFLVTIQEIFRLVYPHIEYDITENDPIVDEVSQLNTCAQVD